jgi:hypothetical protein
VRSIGFQTDHNMIILQSLLCGGRVEATESFAILVLFRSSTL